MVYDSNGNLSQLTDALGHITRYSYSNTGYKISETDALGNRTDYSHDANGNVLSETTPRTDANGDSQTLVTHYTYDAKGRVLSATDALGNITRTEYNAINKQTASIDALGRRTSYDYDSLGNWVKTTYPDNSTETQSYDKQGNKLSDTDRARNTTHTVYDKADRLIATILPDATPEDLNDNPTTQIHYDKAGRVTRNIDANGNPTDYLYDAAGRRTQVTNAQGNITRYQYNENGEQAGVTDARNNATQTVYDKAGRSIQTLFVDGTIRSTGYDALSRRISQTDQAGITTQYRYDNLGRLSQVIDVAGHETRYGYDEQGNKISQTDAEGRITKWHYDKLGRTQTRTLPLGQTEAFSYDKTGNLTHKTDFNGQTTDYRYDSQNRLIQTDYADGQIEQLSYDENGNLTQSIQSTNNSAGTDTQTVNYRYDPQNRLIEEQQADDTVLSYQYDPAGNRSELKVDNGTTIATTQYRFDALNRLKTVTSANNKVTQYSYDPVGNRSQINHANGNQDNYQYDRLNRRTRLESLDNNQAILRAFDYTLSPSGRRTKIVEHNGRTTDYTYDSLYRLLTENITHTASNENYLAEYQYDKVANRIQSIIDGVTTAYTYDNNHRLLQQGGTIYHYDNNGNTLTEILDINSKEYRYNAKNQLQTYTNSGDITHYQYNSAGIRTGQSNQTETIHYVVDSNQTYAQVIQEQVNGIETVSYTYGDDLISQTRNNAIYDYHYDGLGSTRSLSDDNGSLTDQYDYEAFGELLNQVGITENSYQYTGEQFDEGLGEYYLRARYYDQSVGRFRQLDTYLGNNQDPVTLHKYLYGNSDPVTYTDPSGNFGLGNLGAANSIQGILTTINIASTAYDIFQVTTGEQELSARELGAAIIFNLAFQKGGKIAQKFFSKLAVKIGCNSFTANTLVNTKNGLEKIEDVNIGELVWSFNEEAQRNEYREVTHIIQRTNEYRFINILLEDGSVIEATELHPFYSDGIWVDAKDLNVGDKLHLTSGKVVEIKSLSNSEQITTVYNLTIDGNHNYFVGDKGVLVHNCGQNILTARAVAQKAFVQFERQYSGKRFGLCAECSDIFIKTFKNAGVKGKRVNVRTTGNPNDPFHGNLYDDNIGKQISTNGYHEGVVVDNIVFDNYHTQGIPFEKWLQNIQNHYGTIGKPNFWGDF